jgi:hypothetical protein
MTLINFQIPYTLTSSPHSGKTLGKTSLPERAKTQGEKVLPCKFKDKLHLSRNKRKPSKKLINTIHL